MHHIPQVYVLLWRCFFFFNDTATTEIYTLSLHDALPISGRVFGGDGGAAFRRATQPRKRSLRGRHCREVRREARRYPGDRKSTRLNSSHANTSYAVFCLKKKHPYALRSPLRPTLGSGYRT